MPTCAKSPAAVAFLAVFAASLAGGDEVVDRVAIDDADQSWVTAFNARDADAMAQLVTEDVVLMPPGSGPVRGREAAASSWRAAASKANRRLAAKTEEVVIAGDFAWALGGFTRALPDGTIVDQGKFLKIWKRVDGRWKIHRDMFSSNLPPAKRLPEPVRPPDQPVLDETSAGGCCQPDG
jgi:uncharacterized protein (TIGR02246 family)